MSLNESFKKIVALERIDSLIRAHQRASANELWRSAELFGNRLITMGCWQDDDGTWRIPKYLWDVDARRVE